MTIRRSEWRARHEVNRPHRTSGDALDNAASLIWLGDKMTATAATDAQIARVLMKLDLPTDADTMQGVRLVLYGS